MDKVEMNKPIFETEIVDGCQVVKKLNPETDLGATLNLTEIVELSNDLMLCIFSIADYPKVVHSIQLNRAEALAMAEEIMYYAAHGEMKKDSSTKKSFLEMFEREINDEGRVLVYALNHMVNNACHSKHDWLLAWGHSAEITMHFLRRIKSLPVEYLDIFASQIREILLCSKSCLDKRLISYWKILEEKIRQERSERGKILRDCRKEAKELKKEARYGLDD